MGTFRGILIWSILLIEFVKDGQNVQSDFFREGNAEEDNSAPNPFSSDLVDRIKAAKERAQNFGPPPFFSATNRAFRRSPSSEIRAGNRPVLVIPMAKARDFFGRPADAQFGADTDETSVDRSVPDVSDDDSTEAPVEDFTPSRRRSQQQSAVIRLQPIDPDKPAMTATLSKDFSSLTDDAVDEVAEKAKVFSAFDFRPLSATRERRKRTTSTTTTTTTTRRPTTTKATTTAEADNSEDDDDETVEEVATPAPVQVKRASSGRSQQTAGQLAASENIGEKKAQVVGKQAHQLEQITKALASQFSMSAEEIRNLIPLLPTSKTIKQDCLTAAEVNPEVPLDDPFSGDLPACAKSKFRSFDGSCNNIAFPNRGTTASILLRMIEPDYADSISSPRKSKARKELPSARLISKQVAGNLDVPSTKTSLMFMQFGQFINTPKSRGIDKGPPTCCPDDKSQPLDPACYPIMIPASDTFLSPLKQTCMEFVRSLPGTRPGCTLGPREQVNQATAFIDGSAIYGLSRDKADALRTQEDGQLNTFVPKNNPHYNLLPQNTKTSECIDPNETKMCFKAGDSRVNVHLGIAEVQTLWLRQHNLLAKNLKALNPQWKDEKLFHETRHILVAQLQHIAYTEFLPVLLGEQMLDKWNLRVLDSGRFQEYNISLHPGILNEFSTAAYRVGHTMVQKNFRRMSKDYKFRGSENLKTTFFHPFALYDKDAFDEVMFGLVSTPTQEVDSNFVDELNDHLFEIPGDAFGLDLTALNIQRGRDHGLAGWMKWRQLCGLPTAASFDELRGMKIIPDDFVDKMADAYDNIADVDLYAAGTAENHIPGAVIGPTFACIIADQFRRLRFGDRFWYENDLPLSSSLSDKQVEAIRTTTMSRILCDNTPLMEAVQPLAFLLPDSRTNPVVPCNSIPSMNLRQWKA